MKTKILTQHETREVAKMLELGQIVAIPTDTVYGLGVLATNKDAVKRLRNIKHRPDQKALAYMVDSVEKIEAVCELTQRDRFLIQRFLPGPLTFIFKKKQPFLLYHDSSLATLAVRIPKHPFILEMISHLEVGLYVPSANISSQPPAVNSTEVLKDFNGKIEGVVEGEAFNGLASTIIDCSGDELVCLREGVMDFKDILEGLKEYERDF